MMNVYNCSTIILNKISDRSGNITIIENERELPFNVKRIFYLYDIPGGESRGAHAHKECHQFLIAASGSFEVLLDDGKNKRVVALNRANQGLHIPPGIWASELNFSSGSICLVLASHTYNAEDYIRNYDFFMQYKNETPQINFVDFDIDFLEKSWEWLNDSEIKVLTRTPDITKEGQQNWFHSLQSKSNYFIKGMEVDGIKIGVIGLKKIEGERAEYYGYIGEKGYWNKKLSSQMLHYIVGTAINKFHLTQIYLHVGKNNHRAIRAYEKYGFVKSSETNDELTMQLQLF